MQRAKEEEHGARRGLLLHQQLGEEDGRDCLSRLRVDARLWLNVANRHYRGTKSITQV